MRNNSIIKSALVISFTGHCLVLGMPGLEFPSGLMEKPEEITVRIEVEKPPLLPKIDNMGDEKKIKKTEEQLEEPQQDPEPEEAIMEEPVEETVEEKVEVIDPAVETMLRYQDMVKQRIEEARRYPVWAKKQGIQGVVCLEFFVLSDGTSRDVRLIRPSGSDILDKEAIDTIRRAGPFPPIPDNVRYDSIPMKVSIVFSLQ